MRDAPDNQGVYLIPAFVGLGAPYWRPNARAVINGLNRGTGKAHIIRAALESIAYQVHDAVQLLESTSGVSIGELRADGGAADNALLMQFQSDIWMRKVKRSGATELFALGSVYLGGLAVGLWNSIEELQKKDLCEISYVPKMEAIARKNCLSGWSKAVNALLREVDDL